MTGMIAMLNMCRGSASSSSSPVTSVVLMLPSSLRLVLIKRCTQCIGPGPGPAAPPSGTDAAPGPTAPAWSERLDASRSAVKVLNIEENDISAQPHVDIAPGSPLRSASEHRCASDADHASTCMFVYHNLAAAACS